LLQQQQQPLPFCVSARYSKMMSSSATVNRIDGASGSGAAGSSGDASSASGAMNINPSTARNTIVDFSVGSMPANYGYDESFNKEDEDEESNEDTTLFKPRILIMGLRK
jgi:hypothetical protein